MNLVEFWIPAGAGLLGLGLIVGGVLTRRRRPPEPVVEAVTAPELVGAARS
ncbi:MAG: hypothetical protein ABWZ15_00670 [Acidimicrobiia bacterium]